MKYPKQFEQPSLFPDVLKSYEFPSPMKKGAVLQVLVSIDSSTRGTLEHVSAKGVFAGNTYTPSWDEMCFVKDQFFDEEEVVIQLHPKRSEYVNMSKNTLHLWREVNGSYNKL